MSDRTPSAATSPEAGSDENKPDILLSAMGDNRRVAPAPTAGTDTERQASAASPDVSPSESREAELERALEQACRDLQQAHNEIVVLNGIPREHAHRHDWPQWTPQANTIRWAERLLGKELGKKGAQP